jgi:hypothetical protein
VRSNLYERAKRLAMIKARTGMSLSELRDFYGERDLERMDEILGAFRQWREKRKEEKRWKEWAKRLGTNDIEEIKDWMKIFDNPYTAGRWKDHGFVPEEAEAWAKRGFDPSDAEGWDDYEFTPTEAAAWVKAGVVSPVQAVDFEEVGLTPKDVAPWIKVGVTRVEDILKYIESGKSPKQVKRELLRSDREKVTSRRDKEMMYRKWAQRKIKY